MYGNQPLDNQLDIPIKDSLLRGIIHPSVLIVAFSQHAVFKDGLRTHMFDY